MPARTVKPLSVLFTPLKSFNFFARIPHFRNPALNAFPARLAFIIACVVACGLFLLVPSRAVYAQTRTAHVSVVSLVPARIRIDAELTQPTNSLSFPNVYAGVLGLAERIEGVEAKLANGGKISLQKLAPGEYQSSEEFSQVSYLVNLRAPTNAAQMSHVSWLNQERGLLMLADLLPQSNTVPAPHSLSIKLDLPVNWTAAANAKGEGALQYSTGEPGKTVVLIGPDLNVARDRVEAINFSTITSGQWPFASAERSKVARKILAEYSRVTGYKLESDSVLMLLPFPGETGPDRWSAETRGNVVVLLMGRRASGERVLGTLGLILAHELFHLWVPNSLKLSGDYDWFFEGFTLYQALRLDLRLGFISFDEYLDTIGRAYSSYLSSDNLVDLSLVQASQLRWTNPAGTVYERGMLVAFVYDLMLRNSSNCKASLNGVYRRLFRSYSTGQESANETIIKLLEEPQGLETFGKDYVLSRGKTDIKSVLLLFGLQRGAPPRYGRLIVRNDITEPQRKRLHCLMNNK